MGAARGAIADYSGHLLRVLPPGEALMLSSEDLPVDNRHKPRWRNALEPQ